MSEREKNALWFEVMSARTAAEEAHRLAKERHIKWERPVIWLWPNDTRTTDAAKGEQE